MKKVVLLGDSIRLWGYGTKVPEMLGDEYTVYQPEDNCRFVKYTLRGMFDWQDGLKDADVIHWNNGLWDATELFGDGTFTTEEEYINDCLRIARILKKITPNIIFATTTPVWEPGFTRPTRWLRRNSVIAQYNEVAVKVVQRYGFLVNDLYALLKDVPGSYYSDASTHLYTEEATRMITNQVLSTICQCVDVEVTPLDYSRHFGTDSNDVGM